MASVQRSRIVARSVVVLATAVALIVAYYAVLVLIQAFIRNGSLMGCILLLVVGLILLALSSAIFAIGIKWNRAITQRNQGLSAIVCEKQKANMKVFLLIGLDTFQ